jgi:hypothetical protein
MAVGVDDPRHEGSARRVDTWASRSRGTSDSAPTATIVASSTTTTARSSGSPPLPSTSVTPVMASVRPLLLLSSR